jgi:hypothetical protein
MGLDFRSRLSRTAELDWPVEIHSELTMKMMLGAIYEFFRLVNYSTNKDHAHARSGSFLSSIKGRVDKSIIDGLEKSDMIFLIGEWGVGKSRHANSFVESHREILSIRVVKFLGTQSLQEAFFNLTSWSWRVGFIFFSGAVTLVPASIYFWFRGLVKNRLGDQWRASMDVSVSVILALLAIFLFSNRARIIYLTISLVQSSLGLTPSRRRLLVLEDLDRSSMQKADQWALLSNLWRYRHKYLIVYGYANIAQKLELEDYAAKLDGRVIELAANKSINMQLADRWCRSRDFQFPFIEDWRVGNVADYGRHWIASFTPRRILELLEQSYVRDETADAFWIQTSIVRCFWSELRKKYFSDLAMLSQNWEITGDGPDRVSVDLSLTDSMDEERIVKSAIRTFPSTIHKDFLLDLESADLSMNFSHRLQSLLDDHGPQVGTIVSAVARAKEGG